MEIITDKIFDMNYMIGVVIIGVVMSGLVYLISYKVAKANNDDEQIRGLKQPKKVMGIFSSYFFLSSGVAFLIPVSIDVYVNFIKSIFSM